MTGEPAAGREDRVPGCRATTGRQFYSSVLQYGDFSVAVSSDEGSHLSWLEEFLAPSFRVQQRGAVPGSTANCTIVLSSDQDRYARLLARGPSGALVDTYALDTRIVALPAWNYNGTSRAVLDEESGAFYVVDAAARQIEILAPCHEPLSGTGCALRIAFMRAVREVTMQHTRRVGALMHAAAFTLDDGGILVVGPKRAGKTTLLTYALTAAAAALVANDRVLVRTEVGQTLIRGMPTILTLREGMLEFFPRIRTRLLDRGLHIGVTVQEAMRRANSGSPIRVRPPKDGRFAITGKQLCEAVGSTQIAETKLAGILFPRISNRRGALTLRRIEPDDALSKLTQSVFGSGRRSTSHALFDLADEPALHGTIEPLSVCRMLASTVPCFICDVGPHSYNANGSTEALIEQFRST